jgi:hypothetical protein
MNMWRNCTCFGLRDACNRTHFLCAYTAASDSTVQANRGIPAGNTSKPVRLL